MACSFLKPNCTSLHAGCSPPHLFFSPSNQQANSFLLSIGSKARYNHLFSVFFSSCTAAIRTEPRRRAGDGTAVGISFPRIKRTQHLPCRTLASFPSAAALCLLFFLRSLPRFASSPRTPASPLRPGRPRHHRQAQLRGAALSSSSCSTSTSTGSRLLASRPPLPASTRTASTSVRRDGTWRPRLLLLGCVQVAGRFPRSWPSPLQCSSRSPPAASSPCCGHTRFRLRPLHPGHVRQDRRRRQQPPAVFGRRRPRPPCASKIARLSSSSSSRTPGSLRCSFRRCSRPRAAVKVVSDICDPVVKNSVSGRLVLLPTLLHPLVLRAPAGKALLCWFSLLRYGVP